MSKRKSLDSRLPAASRYNDADDVDDCSTSSNNEDEQGELMPKRRNDNEKNDNTVDSKIRKVIEATFDEEINYKKYELEKINERIFEAQNMLDKLRVCIICNYYSQNGRLSQAEYINHPAIKELKCEHLDMVIDHKKSTESRVDANETSSNRDKSTVKMGGEDIQQPTYTQTYEVKICIGNVSKYIGNGVQKDEKSDEQKEKAPTHKWMVYVRSPQCARLEAYIKKVIFFLHSSYKPNDIVEIKSSPFEITRRGWGEFPIQAQIHFKDSRNKRVDVIHQVKLDWTQTGLQTFGGETSASAKLILRPSDFILDSTSTQPAAAALAIAAVKEKDVVVKSSSSTSYLNIDDNKSNKVQENTEKDHQNGKLRDAVSTTSLDVNTTKNRRLYLELILKEYKQYLKHLKGH